jgi:hypothetical protein
MTHHRPHHCGPRGRRGMRLPLDREQMLARLEEHQRDLEQRTADVADLIRRLRDEPAGAGAPDPTPA